MIAKLLEEKEEAVQVNELAHLSHSRISRYLLCPEQYRLYYVERLRPRRYSASLVFGRRFIRRLRRSFEPGQTLRYHSPRCGRMPRRSSCVMARAKPGNASIKPDGRCWPSS
jgi:hypothetical protein